MLCPIKQSLIKLPCSIKFIFINFKLHVLLPYDLRHIKGWLSNC
uniref:Uncharacterized protein n=1 Tax=Arundo donax TaxID=35708 RepID=A0A0A9CBT5_ARUDO